MAKSSYPSEPTKILVEVTTTVNGGGCHDAQAARVQSAILHALKDAAAKAGLSCAWELRAKSVTPKRFDATLARKNERPARGREWT